jgi:hypothetical protein
MLKIKEEHLPERCEICHKNDCFDPKTNFCSRCSGIVRPVVLIKDPPARFGTLTDYSRSNRGLLFRLFSTLIDPNIDRQQHISPSYIFKSIIRFATLNPAHLNPYSSFFWATLWVFVGLAIFVIGMAIFYSMIWPLLWLIIWPIIGSIIWNLRLKKRLSNEPIIWAFSEGTALVTFLILVILINGSVINALGGIICGGIPLFLVGMLIGLIFGIIGNIIARIVMKISNGGIKFDFDDDIKIE